MSDPVLPVIVVGAGPTGLTAATLLARLGIPCVVLDRWESIYPQPRAVHLDDEIYRLLARVGIADEFAAITRPAHGLRLIAPDQRVLAEFRRDVAAGRHGYPKANMFDQPELERLLRANLTRHPGVTLRGNVEVTGLVQDGAGHVRVDLVDRITGEPQTLLTQYVLGCDGANSVARTAIGSNMHDLNFEQRWLVVDIDTEVDLDQWEGVHQVCDTRRAATYMRVGDTRYRWEFRLGEGETADDYHDPARLRPLLAPWTGPLPDGQLEIVRLTEYVFRAQIADRWRDRRIFLLGDAAHLTPPFIGQGLGAGLRDAANLSWKLAGVLHGTLLESVLATYEIERVPHTRAMIRMAKLVGAAMTAGGRGGDLARRLLAPRLHHVPGVKRLVLDGETPPLRRCALVARPRLRRGLAGQLCPNPQLDDRHRLDDLIAGRFAVVTRIEPTAAQRDDVEGRGAVLLVARPGSELDRWLRRGRTRAVIIRPDGTVLRAGRNLDALSGTLPGAPRPGSARHGEDPDRGNPPPASGSGPRSRRTGPSAPTTRTDTSIPSFDQQKG